MANEALRVPIELKDCRFRRSESIVEFGRLLLQTEPGSYRPDPEFGCRVSTLKVDYSDDPIRDIRNHIQDQFERYLGLVVKVDVSQAVHSPAAQYHCTVLGLIPGGERFQLNWEF